VANIGKFTGIQPVSVEIHSDCLALWQEGKVDAITGDDAILAGFRAQDPHAVIVGESLEDEPYGLAVSAQHKEFARFLNAVLEGVRADGTWQQLYSTWLRSSLGSASPPAPNYGRPA
jgi:polar amino acid transport system substrate-binding protein